MTASKALFEGLSPVLIGKGELLVCDTAKKKKNKK